MGNYETWHLESRIKVSHAIDNTHALSALNRRRYWKCSATGTGMPVNPVTVTRWADSIEMVSEALPRPCRRGHGKLSTFTQDKAFGLGDSMVRCEDSGRSICRIWSKLNKIFISIILVMYNKQKIRIVRMRLLYLQMEIVLLDGVVQHVPPPHSYSSPKWTNQTLL